MKVYSELSFLHGRPSVIQLERSVYLIYFIESEVAGRMILPNWLLRGFVSAIWGWGVGTDTIGMASCQGRGDAGCNPATSGGQRLATPLLSLSPTTSSLAKMLFRNDFLSLVNIVWANPTAVVLHSFIMSNI